MNRVVELYEANHLMVLIIVFIGFIIYVSSMKNKFHKSLFVQNEVEVVDENEDEIGASAPRIYIGIRVFIKYILTDEIVEIEICDTQNRRENNVVFVNHHMPLATSLLNKEVGDIIKFKKNTTDKNYIYVEVHQIGDYGNEEEIHNPVEENNILANSINRDTKCNSKNELINILRNWLRTNEETIGVGRGIRWIDLNINGSVYFLNSDSTRFGIERFISDFENNNQWKVIVNNRGIYNKVTNDINGLPITGLYFYADIHGERKI